ncbi:hypothetical protein IFM47457_04943 [Aspergillus lentulus]|nr:hypothetical protein IFM47457_04943 [Aspergillus lentulus]
MFKSAPNSTTEYHRGTWSDLVSLARNRKVFQEKFSGLSLPIISIRDPQASSSTGRLQTSTAMIGPITSLVLPVPMDERPGILSGFGSVPTEKSIRFAESHSVPVALAKSRAHESAKARVIAVLIINDDSIGVWWL